MLQFRMNCLESLHSRLFLYHYQVKDRRRRRIMKRRMILLLSLFLILEFSLPLSVYAQEGDVEFSVKAVIPDNQIDTKKSYFDLRMQPKQKQEMETIIYNSSDEEISINISVHNATTNQNGLIVYEQDSENDPSLKFPLNTIVTVSDQEITIPAKRSKTITATIGMPDDEFDGVILGGLHFEKANKDDESSQAVNIQNKYAYVIGIQLSENDHEVCPDLQLKSIKPDLINYRTAVVATIQNNKPVIIQDLKVQASVFKKGDKEVLHESYKENMSMAPNSNMDFVIDWENQELEKGEYVLKMQAQTAEKEWKWDEPFTIEQKEEALNKQAVELEKNMTNGYLVALSVLTIIIVILIYVIIQMKRRVS